ncbi:MAG: hypothetical protein WDN28_33460 [Chthoniobacter sp.]
MTLLRSLPLLGLLLFAITASAEDAPAPFPFEPAQLLTVLAAAPADWKITRSDAATTLGQWLKTRATRTFQPPPPSATADAAPASAPGEVEVSVIDTAGFAPSLAAFADFTPGKNGALEKKLLGTLPAIVISGEGGRQFSQVLVSNRYIVEITLPHLSPVRLEDWLRGLHFDFLPPAASVPTVSPREFRLTHVDELHPENNHSYVVSTTSSKRLAAFLKTLPPEKSDTETASQDPSPRP